MKHRGDSGNLANRLTAKLALQNEQQTAQQGIVMPQTAGTQSTSANQSVNNNSAVELAQQWVNGASIHWAEHYADALPALIRLPLYVFEKQRCWVDNPLCLG